MILRCLRRCSRPRRHGCGTVAAPRVQGPFNLSINEETGLLIEGFDTPPMIFMPHDPRYAAARIEAQGYSKAKDVIAYLFDMKIGFPPRIRRLADRFAATRRDVAPDRHVALRRRVQHGDGDLQRRLEPELGFRAVHRGRTQAHGQGPEAADGSEAHRRSPSTDGKPVAFGIMLPNLNEAIRDFNGKLLPFNWIKLLLRLKKGTASARAAAGCASQLQRRGLARRGSPFLDHRQHAQGRRRKGIKRIELSWILEDNRPMRRIIEELGAVAYKTYRVYEKNLQ